MFDFSLGELLVVAAAAVICISPKDMPVVLRALAKGMAQLKALASELKTAVHELAEESGIKDAQAQFQAETRKIMGDNGQEYEAYDVEGVEAMVALPPEEKPVIEPPRALPHET